MLKEERSRFPIYPPPDDVFAALRLTAPHEVKVVILGQDPYHTPGMARGLSFSVPAETHETQIPPSLKNIFKELESDLGFAEVAPNPDLTRWAKQGVLLLNTCLTVRKGEPESHAGIGWQPFTSAALQVVVDSIRPTVFMLWGAHAQRTMSRLAFDWNTHLNISSAHPSPLSAHRGFFGSRPFSRANAFLEEAGIPGIQWQGG